MKAGDFLRHYVLHNLGLKIFSLLLAFGLWYLVAMGKLIEPASSPQRHRDAEKVGESEQSLGRNNSRFLNCTVSQSGFASVSVSLR